MALTSTIFNLTIELTDLDRGLYDTLDLRVAQHPSESMEYLLTRVLAYALQYEPGIAMTDGLSAGDEPAVVVRDLTGRVTAWIEVGLPDPARIHRARKSVDRVVIYAHKDVRAWLARCAGEKIHNADDILIRAFDPAFISAAVEHLARRSALTVWVSEREMFLTLGDHSFQSPLTEHSLGVK